MNALLYMTAFVQRTARRVMKVLDEMMLLNAFSEGLCTLVDMTILAKMTAFF
jgi:hypothetical protein